MRTADCPVAKVPLMVVRHTVAVPGTLKQTLRQSPYLMSLAARSPRSADSWPAGLSAVAAPAAWASCCPRAKSGWSNSIASSAGSDDRNTGPQLRRLIPVICCLLRMSSGLPLPVQERAHQRRPHCNGVGGVDEKMSFVAEWRQQVILGRSSGAGVG